MPEITLPNNWRPREYQEPFWRAMEGGTRRAVCVWHRRAGKDLTAIHYCATQAFQRRGLYWHLFPTYNQGRKAIWEGMDKDGTPFLEAFPEGTWYRKRDDDMTLWLQGGSKYQVVGTDHIDRLMGANPIGVIVSEYAIQNPAAWELISPILTENGGWAVFVYTPRARNHGYHLYKYAQDHPDTWFSELLTVDDTKSVNEDVLAEEKDRQVREFFEQEYYCSFNAALVGSIYGDTLEWLYEHERIGVVPRKPEKVVYTGWDLGIGDSTAIWFAQQVGRETRIIDYYEKSGEPIDHYVKVLRDKGYIYGDAYLPHDAGSRELGTGLTIEEQLRSLGVRCRVSGKFPISDQHAAVRTFLRGCFIAEKECERGIQALREYVKQAIENERGPDGEVLYRDRPLHNWASHGASALATLALGMRPEFEGEWQQPDASYVV